MRALDLVRDDLQRGHHRDAGAVREQEGPAELLRVGALGDLVHPDPPLEDALGAVGHHVAVLLPRDGVGRGVGERGVQVHELPPGREENHLQLVLRTRAVEEGVVVYARLVGPGGECDDLVRAPLGYVGRHRLVKKVRTASLLKVVVPHRRSLPEFESSEGVGEGTAVLADRAVGLRQVELAALPGAHHEPRVLDAPLARGHEEHLHHARKLGRGAHVNHRAVPEASLIECGEWRRPCARSVVGFVADLGQIVQLLERPPERSPSVFVPVGGGLGEGRQGPDVALALLAHVAARAQVAEFRAEAAVHEDELGPGCLVGQVTRHLPGQLFRARGACGPGMAEARVPKEEGYRRVPPRLLGFRGDAVRGEGRPSSGVLLRE
mmetsp:Transcript_32211/g.72674  ORF Transcript_32211/g.72674 Transcript_32211/m.72674 type:complete len:379 (+) Transcript_32211:480-1616(+)